MEISGGPTFQTVGWDVSQSGLSAAVIENCVPVVLFWELVGSEASVLVCFPEFPMFLLAICRHIIGFLSKELNILWKGVQPMRRGSFKDKDMIWVRGKASNLHGTWADVNSGLQVNWTVISRTLSDPRDLLGLNK